MTWKKKILHGALIFFFLVKTDLKLIFIQYYVTPKNDLRDTQKDSIFANYLNLNVGALINVEKKNFLVSKLESRISAIWYYSNRCICNLKQMNVP